MSHQYKSPNIDVPIYVPAINLNNADQGNGFRTVKAHGSCHELVLTVPRTRSGGFFPLILGLIREEDSEKNKLVTSLYTRGLTTEAITEIWEEMYGTSYSKSQISQLMTTSKQEVANIVLAHSA